MVVSVPTAGFFESNILSLMLSSLGLSRGLADLVLVVALAPFIEEFAKAIPLAYRHGETQRSLMTMGFLVGLGFGIIEFIEYVFVGDVFFVYRIPGVFFHAVSTSIVGHGIAEKKPLRFYLIAVGLHALNNIIAVTIPFFSLILLVFVAAVYYWYYLYERTPETVIPY